MAFQCTVTLPDGSPAASEIMEIAVSSHFKQNYTTDSSGTLTFSFPLDNPDEETMSMQVSSIWMPCSDKDSQGQPPEQYSGISQIGFRKIYPE